MTISPVMKSTTHDHLVPSLHDNFTRCMGVNQPTLQGLRDACFLSFVYFFSPHIFHRSSVPERALESIRQRHPWRPVKIERLQTWRLHYQKDVRTRSLVSAFSLPRQTRADLLASWCSCTKGTSHACLGSRLKSIDPQSPR